MVSAVKNRKLSVLLVFSLIIALAFSLSVSAAYRWSGNVTIGTNTSTTGALVGGYWGGLSSPNQTFAVGGGVGVPSNGYVITVPCDPGDTRFLKVWGINATPVACNKGPATGNSTNLSVSLLSAGDSCTYTQACGSNICCSGGAEITVPGTTSGTCASTCTTSSSSSSSSGGGSSSSSGGGASSSSETSTQVVVSGSTKTAVSFTKSATIAVKEVEIATTEGAAVTNGKVTVAETTVSSSTSAPLTAGNTKVYKYLSITKSNIKDADLKEAKITFEVAASWFTANNIDPSTVKLNRYVSSQWVALSTALVSSAGGNYVFEATTPGFSIFAISGEAKAAKLTAFELIDVIRDFYAGKSAYTAFQVIDLIRGFYA